MRTAITADRKQTIDVADMFTITKQAGLDRHRGDAGIILSVPLWLPALYSSTDITVRDQAERAGNFVKSKDIGGNEIITRWRRPDADYRPSI
jgi:hypothetical protein